MCTPVSKSESPGGALIKRTAGEDKEAGQPSANCQCPGGGEGREGGSLAMPPLISPP